MPNIGLGLGVFGFVALALAAIVAVVYESYSEQAPHGHGGGGGGGGGGCGGGFTSEKPSTNYPAGYDTPHYTRKKKKKGSDIENTICVICQEDIEDTNKTTLVCKHSFHYNCLQKWHNTGKNECPICRHKLPQIL